MANAIGTQGDIMINYQYYPINKGTYSVEKKRYFSHRTTTAGILWRIDMGPLFYEWKFQILLVPGLTTYNFADANSKRTALWGLYNTPNQLFPIITPEGGTYQCIFVDLKETHHPEATWVNVGQDSVHASAYLIDVELLQGTVLSIAT